MGRRLILSILCALCAFSRMKTLTKSLFGIPMLFLLGLLLSGAVNYPVFAEEKKEEKKPETPQEILQKSAGTYYDFKKEGVLRYSCFVTAPEVAKSAGLRSEIILKEVDYEYIWELDKPIKVKPRDIPTYFGEEAREDAQKCATFMEITFRVLFNTTNPVGDILKLIDTLAESDKYEITSSKDKALTKIEIIPKKAPEPKRKSPRQKDKPAAKEEFVCITIWVNKDYEINKFEIASEKEKVTVIVIPQKYNKLWNIKQLDITKRDNEDAFMERFVVDCTYAYPEKIMLLSSIRLTRLDKDGKTLVRRNEVNPVTANFSKYEIENKEKGKK